mmetsp:Transcript_6308/g.10648  ORF Transcript_6308/g.10648 Transcript_6308/m.10648 type:complete len:314 (+) Transcript_6308:138-1079(+)
MGCHSTKLPAATSQACEVRENTAARKPESPASGTLLACEHATRVAELATVQETVVKPNNSEWLMMSRDLASSVSQNPPSSKERELDSAKVEITEITLTDEALDDGERSSSLLPSGQADMGADREFSKFGDPAAEALPSKPQRRTRTCPCDCCDADMQKPLRRRRLASTPPGPELESLIVELFRAHDLNSDGLLDEQELIKLNEAVAEVHDAREFDAAAVREKYSNLFREKLDSEGRPVPYPVFRDYILKLLCELDSHEDAQEMLMEQFLVEARLARTVVTGAPLQTDNLQDKSCYPSCMRFCKVSEAAIEFRR